MYFKSTYQCSAYSQRHKIESSGFLTIDVLYRKRRKRNINLPWIRLNKGKA